jgi:hypothetical protein
MDLKDILQLADDVTDGLIALTAEQVAELSMGYDGYLNIWKRGQTDRTAALIMVGEYPVPSLKVLKDRLKDFQQ